MTDEKPFSAKTAKAITKRVKTPPPTNGKNTKSYTITLKGGESFTGTFHAIRVQLKRNNHDERLRYRLDNGVNNEADLLKPSPDDRPKKRQTQYGKGK